MSEFWTRYANLVPRIERACRSMSRLRTGGGMSPEEMQAWIDDRVWRMRRQGEFPIFHDDPDDETAVSRVQEHIPLLVRWAFLARSRAFFRRKAREEKYAQAFARAERLGAVRRADDALEQAEQVRADLERLRTAVDPKTRARLAATWQERSEARRIAAALRATDESLHEQVEGDMLKPNTIDQIRSRARARVRDILSGARTLSMLLVAMVAFALFPQVSHAAGEQTGGGRKGRLAEVSATDSAMPLLHGRIAANGGEQTGGRGG